eukprot:scaffold32398_cov63-Phaeocystis_antarctica.AAC.2
MGRVWWMMPSLVPSLALTKNCDQPSGSEVASTAKPWFLSGQRQWESATEGRQQKRRGASLWHPRAEGAVLGPRVASSKRVGPWGGGWSHGLLRARAL